MHTGWGSGAWAFMGNSRRGIPAKSGTEPLAETAWLSSGVVISVGGPHLAGAHPMGKWKSGEPGGEGLAGWGAARSSGRAAWLTWSHGAGTSLLWPTAPQLEVSTRLSSRWGGVCFGHNSQTLGPWLVFSVWGRWELTGFPQVDSRSLAGTWADTGYLLARWRGALSPCPSQEEDLSSGFSVP